ncbi:MerR family transcriptional regulator [bacterium]|nr:MerR family transcriptional regulator [bacterium]
MDQLYYTISQVSESLGEKPHVIRYWEKIFTGFRPEKTKTGQRRYRAEDLAFLQRVRRMLREDGLTITGVKRRLQRRRRIMEQSDTLAEVRADLERALGALRGEDIQVHGV